MKKTISTLLLSTMLGLSAAIPATAAPVPAVNADAEFEEFYDLDGYFELVEPVNSAAIKPCPGGTYKVRRNTKTKKKVVNALIAGGIGAAVGGGLGGGRGALLGLGAGSGGYLVYRYVRDRNGRCVPRYVGRG
ncbi:MAG: hypothetical protein QM785_16090 [Pyrinomonadaceae bacterium]